MIMLFKATAFYTKVGATVYADRNVWLSGLKVRTGRAPAPAIQMRTGRAPALAIQARTGRAPALAIKARTGRAPAL